MRHGLVLVLLLAACSPADPGRLSATDIEIRRVSERMAAGYLLLENSTDRDLRIERVASPQFARVEVHETTLRDGISRMRKLDELLVPAGGSVRLQRGGLHLMLMQPETGDGPLRLTFFSNGQPLLTVETEMESR